MQRNKVILASFVICLMAGPVSAQEPPEMPDHIRIQDRIGGPFGTLLLNAPTNIYPTDDSAGFTYDSIQSAFFSSGNPIARSAYLIDDLGVASDVVDVTFTPDTTQITGAWFFVHIHFYSDPNPAVTLPPFQDSPTFLEGNDWIDVTNALFPQFDSLHAPIVVSVLSPEPSTLVMFALGAVSLVAYGWRRKKARAMLAAS